MSGFSFGTTAGASQGFSTSKLEGNNIYTVKFDGVEIKDLVGKKETNAGVVYQTLILKFSTEQGTFEHTIFAPNPAKDFARTETKYTDKNTGVEGTIPQPSNVESMMLLFKHAIDAINPTIAKAIDDGSKPLTAPDWNGLRILVAKILDAGKGKEIQIKLLKNNKGEAQFPGFFTAINRDGKPYIKNNFIGQNLAFTTFESARIAKEIAATPTPVASYQAPTAGAQASAPVSDGLDLNFDMPIL